MSSTGVTRVLVLLLGIYGILLLVSSRRWMDMIPRTKVCSLALLLYEEGLVHGRGVMVC